MGPRVASLTARLRDGLGLAGGAGGLPIQSGVGCPDKLAFLRPLGYGRPGAVSSWALGPHKPAAGVRIPEGELDVSMSVDPAGARTRSSINLLPYGQATTPTVDRPCFRPSGVYDRLDLGIVVLDGIIITRLESEP